MLALRPAGNHLPFRRLCADFGAEVTLSEMAFARQLAKGDRKERAILRRAENEKCYGARGSLRLPTTSLHFACMPAPGRMTLARCLHVCLGTHATASARTCAATHIQGIAYLAQPAHL